MPRNVLLLILDSARVQNMGLYGYRRETTPFLTDLAESATVFEQARAPAVWSVPSHVSIFSGLHVQEHGILNDEYEFSLKDVGLFSQLSEAGYETAVFSENPFLTGVESGLQDGFDVTWRSNRASERLFDEGMDPDWFVGEHGEGEYISFLKAALDHPETFKSLLNGITSKVEYRTGIDIAQRRNSTGFDYASEFLDWADESTGPWAACVNLMDTHSPFKPMQKYDNWGSEEVWERQGTIDYWTQMFGDESDWKLKQLIDLYDGCIRQADDIIKSLVEGVPDDTLIIITADHGEGFGEDSELDSRKVVGHSMDIHEVLTHVPLIIKDPDESKGQRNTDLVSLVDIPRVIKNRLGETTVDEEFVSPVVSHSGELFSTKNDRLAREYPTKQEETGYAVYDDEGGVKKSVIWEDRRFTRRFSSVFEFDETTHDQALNALNMETSLARGTRETSPDSEVTERLENLGYM